MIADERVIVLLELHRDGLIQPAELSELDGLIERSDEIAAWAVESNELHRMLEQALRSPRRRADGVDSVMRAVRALPRTATAARVMGTVRAFDRIRIRARRRVIGRIVAWGAVAAGLVLAASLWAVSRTRPGESAVFATGDGARVIRAGIESPVSAGAVLAPGDRLLCGPGSASVRYADGTALDLQAGTRMDIQTGTGKRLRLDGGRLSASVTPQRSSVVIATAQSIATVVGTRFVLDADGERTRVSVSEGTVRMERTDASGATAIDVGRGHAAEARADQPLVARTIQPVLSFDFEDGALPPLFASGRPCAPPIADGSRLCLIGTPEPQWYPDRDVVCIRSSAYATYQDGLRCSFDFLVTGPVTDVGVMIYDTEQNQNYGARSVAYEPDRWHHMEFEFARLTPYLRSGDRMSTGDHLTSLYVVPGGASAARIYVDNLTIWREIP